MNKHTYPTVEQIESMTRAELIEAFLAAKLGHIPKNASQGFLRGNLAWATQAAAEGNDPVALRKSLVTKARKTNQRRYPLYKPGTRLIREWQGVTHEVTVEKKGFLWNAEHYRSLSRIAREITGTKWSGPRFFGLNGDNQHG